MTVWGQHTEFRPEIGMGTYSMSDLKGLLEQSVSTSAFGLKTTDDFPAYVFYGLDLVQYLTPRFGLGISSGFYSTGGRNDYADYSGSYREEILVQALNLGLLLSLRDTLGYGFFYNIELAGGIKFSDISMEDQLLVSDYKQGSAYDLESKGVWVEPQIRAGRTFFRNFSFAAFAGYEFNLESKMFLKQNDKMSLKPKIDWSGIRVGVCVSYSILYQ